MSSRSLSDFIYYSALTFEWVFAAGAQVIKTPIRKGPPRPSISLQHICVKCSAKVYSVALAFVVPARATNSLKYAPLRERLQANTASWSQSLYYIADESRVR